ncbi:unnamed protein product [Auanema sp. JU1783]|nr:unnamed protein product [Auanema sp. JU1783]
MAADDLSNTSTNRLRALQYNEKVASLNKQFIKQLQKWMEQTPHYDFTDTVKSYMEHINHLSKLYSINQHATADNKPVRSIAKARRRLNRDSVDAGDEEDKTIPNISTPAVDPPRRSMAFGNVSEIFDANATPTVSSAPTPSTTRGKRAIRGGGLLGGEEKVIFKGAGGNSDNSQDAPTYPAVTINFPKPTPGFWAKQFAGLPPSEKFDFTDNSKDDKKNDETIVEKKDDTVVEKKTETKPATAPALSFGGFSKAPEKDKDSATSTETKEAPKIGFFSSLQTSASGSAPTTTFPSFTPAPFTGFNFGSTATNGVAKPADSGAAGEAGAGGDEEYVPPKVDVLVKEDPDSFFTSKCSVFKMSNGEYSKLGVGVMHLKNVDGKKSILVRAAVATGTVWINASLNNTVKVSGVSNDPKGEKINLIIPLSSTEMGTFLVRFASKAVADEMKGLIEEHTK